MGGMNVPLATLYYIPQSPTTLISVSELAEVGYTVTAAKVLRLNSMRVVSPAGDACVLPAINGLYSIPVSKSSSPPAPEPFVLDEVGPTSIRGFAHVRGKHLSNTHVGSKIPN
jgi:hypothetical protein